MQAIYSKFNEKQVVQGRVKVITTDAITHEVLRETEWSDNLIMVGVDTGLTLILDRLNGDNSYSLNLTHAEIGTGTNPPAITDVALQTPVVRGAKALGTLTGNILSLQFFYADGDLANGVYTEFGAFIDGTATIGTGKIFERALFGLPYTKGASEDTTVQLDITIT